MENKTSKYFKYAIGEIVLVVIGILIALQINNWNENRKQHKDDIVFLKTLKTELALDTIALTQKVLSYTNMNLKLEKTLQLFKAKNQITKSEYQLIASAIKSIEMLTPINKNTQINNLNLANGMLMRIDKQLNQEYLNYLESTNYNNDIITKLGVTLQTISIQHVFSKFDFSTQPTSSTEIELYYHFEYSEIRNDRLVKNSINKSLFYRSFCIKYAQWQKEIATKLLYDIDEFLNGKIETND